MNIYAVKLHLFLYTLQVSRERPENANNLIVSGGL